MKTSASKHYTKQYHVLNVTCVLNLLLKSKRQAQFRQTAVLLTAVRAQAKPRGWRKTLCRGACSSGSYTTCWGQRDEPRQTAPAETCKLRLWHSRLWHWHRAALTPLPGVSAPAGLRPSPLAHLFAAAQPSLCPVSAGKVEQHRTYQDNSLDLESVARARYLMVEGQTFLKPNHSVPTKLRTSWAHLLLNLSIGSLHNYLLPSRCGGSGVLLHSVFLSRSFVETEEDA